MDNNKILFWNVDTQFDFINPQGKLYVPGAETIIGNLEKITNLARQENIRVINTADYHNPDSGEISKTPDFINTFPEHCMAGSVGAEFINETKPDAPAIIDLSKDIQFFSDIEIYKSRNIVIRKDVFDVFSGNNNTDRLLNFFKPETVIVYGVTTNICVDYAVAGLVERVRNVYVVTDAIKELPGIPMPFVKWEKLGVKRISFEELVLLLSR